MNSNLLYLVDQALVYSLWLVLILFLVLLVFAAWKLRGRRKETSQKNNASGNPWQAAMKAFLLSLACGLLLFVVLLFTPLPFVSNLVTSQSWQVVPLRVTALEYDRFHEGFELTGEVWNQTEHPVETLQAKVTILGTDQKILAEPITAVRPDPLGPGRAGEFTLRYTENSPLIKGYQLSFLNASGERIPHVTGFDVQ